jgi:hypothetical protein
VVATSTATATVPAAARHGRQERDPRRCQRRERDDHGRAREHDRAARGCDRAGDRVLDALPGFGELLAVPGHDKQRVVDSDGQPDHRGQHGGGIGQLDEAGQELHGQHAD